MCDGDSDIGLCLGPGLCDAGPRHTVSSALHHSPGLWARRQRSCSTSLRPERTSVWTPMCASVRTTVCARGITRDQHHQHPVSIPPAHRGRRPAVNNSTFPEPPGPCAIFRPSGATGADADADACAARQARSRSLATQCDMCISIRRRVHHRQSPCHGKHHRSAGGSGVDKARFDPSSATHHPVATCGSTCLAARCRTHHPMALQMHSHGVCVPRFRAGMQDVRPGDLRNWLWPESRRRHTRQPPL